MAHPKLKSFCREAPLARCPTEPKRAHRALWDLAQQTGPERELSALVDLYEERLSSRPDAKVPTLSLEELRRWERLCLWKDRLQRFDALRQVEERADWERLHSEIRRADFDLGAQLREVLERSLKELEKGLSKVEYEEEEVVTGENGEAITRKVLVRYVTPKIANPAQLARAAQIASDMQRLAAGMPQHGQVSKESGSGGQQGDRPRGYVMIVPDNGRAAPSEIPPGEEAEWEKEAKALEDARAQYAREVAKAKLLESADRIAPNPSEPAELDNSVEKPGFSLPSNNRDDATGGDVARKSRGI